MLSSLGGHYPWVSRIATTAQTLGPVGEGRPRRQCERPGARVEQNLWQAAIRKCSLAPAPPTGRHPKHRGFDNVLGASGGRLAAPGPRKGTGASNYSNKVPSPRELGLGGRSPPHSSGTSERKGQLRSSWGLRVQPARSEAQPPELPPPPSSAPSAPGRGPPRVSSRALPSVSWNLRPASSL